MSITTTNLMSLQSYNLERRKQQRQMIAHRRARSLPLGPCMRLQFEDESTLRYQIQEVLRAERISDAGDTQEQIDTYAHLLPDGNNWKATLLIELPDAQQRRRELPQLNEAAHCVYVDVPQHSRIVAQANEDLPDRHLERPSAVHFLRFEFPPSLRLALLAGASAKLGCAHHQYEFRRVIPPATVDLLRRDLVSSAQRRCTHPEAAHV
jgi:hypothetical protein